VKGIRKFRWLALCILAVLTLVAALWIHHGVTGKRAQRTRLPAPNNLKQIGLTFRIERNSFTAPFSITGEITDAVSTRQTR
jgi:hypothetical protein